MRLTITITITIIVVLAALVWLGWRYSRRLLPFRPPPTTTLSPAQTERLSQAIRMYLERHAPLPP